MQTYIHIFAIISEVLQTCLCPSSFSLAKKEKKNKIDMSIIVQNFKTKVMPPFPQNSLSQVRTSTLRSEATTEASKLIIPLKELLHTFQCA